MELMNLEIIGAVLRLFDNKGIKNFKSLVLIKDLLQEMISEGNLKYTGKSFLFLLDYLITHKHRFLLQEIFQDTTLHSELLNNLFVCSNSIKFYSLKILNFYFENFATKTDFEDLNKFKAVF